MIGKKKKVKRGFCWHVYHNELISYCYNYDERVRWIKHYKPDIEIATRIRLFQPVKGKLSKTLLLLGKKYHKARASYQKLSSARNGTILNNIVKALDASVKKNKKSIKKLHEKECPDCPWDGRNIIF